MFPIIGTHNGRLFVMIDKQDLSLAQLSAIVGFQITSARQKFTYDIIKFEPYYSYSTYYLNESEPGVIGLSFDTSERRGIKNSSVRELPKIPDKTICC